jgi:hypothetical protein
MNYIANARLMLTKCRDCLGCNRLEDEKFTGDNKCLNYRKAILEDGKSIRMWGVNREHEVDGRAIHRIPTQE